MASDRLRMKVGALVDSLGGLKLKWRITFSRPKPYVNRFLLLGTESSSKFAVLRQMFSLCERFPSKFQRCDALWNEQSSSVDHESLHAIRLEILRLAVRVATNISRNNSSASPRFSEITTRLVEAFDEAERLDFASLSSILQDFVQDPEFHSKSTDFEGIPDFLTADRVKRIFDDKTMVKWSDVIESNSSLEGCVFNFKIRGERFEITVFYVSDLNELPSAIDRWVEENSALRNTRIHILYAASLSDFGVPLHPRENLPTASKSDYTLAHFSQCLRSAYLPHCSLLIYFTNRDRFEANLQNPSFRHAIDIQLQKELAEVAKERQNAVDSHLSAVAARFSGRVSSAARFEKNVYHRFTSKKDDQVLDGLLAAVKDQIISDSLSESALL